MPIGITNVTTVNMSNLTDISNITQPVEFFINVNWIVYNGWLWFILLLVAWLIMFMAAQRKQDQPLNNLMYSGIIITIVSLLSRAVVIANFGIERGLLDDHKMWVFPLITILVAVIVWGSKD